MEDKTVIQALIQLITQQILNNLFFGKNKFIRPSELMIILLSWELRGLFLVFCFFS